MNYHYPQQQHPQQPLPTTFPSSTPYTLPPPLLQALHRLATFSSDIQLLTSHFAPHLHLNSSRSSFAKPTFQSLARRRKPTPRSTAWRLQKLLPPDPRAHPPIAIPPLSSLVPTTISTLPPRPVSAPPLEPHRHVSKVSRSSSIPRAAQSSLSITAREAQSMDLKIKHIEPLDLLVHNDSPARITPTSRVDCITPNSPTTSTSQTNATVIIAPIVNTSAPTATVDLQLSSDVDSAPEIGLDLIHTQAPFIPAVDQVTLAPQLTAANDLKTVTVSNSVSAIKNPASNTVINPILKSETPTIKTFINPGLASITTIDSLSTHAVPLVSNLNQETVVHVDSEPIDVVMDLKSIDSIPANIIKPALFLPAADQAVLESGSISTTSSPPAIDYNSTHTIADIEPGTTIDPIPNASSSRVDTSTIVDLVATTTVGSIDMNSDINPRPALAMTDTDRVPTASARDLVHPDQLGSNPSQVISPSLSLVAEPISSISEVPTPPTTPSQLTNSIISSNNANSSSVNKNNKKKKKKKKAKTPTLTTPSPQQLNSELCLTNNFVLSSEEGWIEFDPVSGNRVEPSPCGHTYEDWEHANEKAFDPKEGWIDIDVDHDNKWHPRPQRTHYEQLIMVNHLLDQHLDYLLLRVNRQGILLGKDRDKDPHEQDVICYSSTGEFSFRRENGKVFHHPSDSLH